MPQIKWVTHSAVWVCLPYLPIEFYDAILLKNIGNAIVKLLKVDACISATLRGHYARLCVQIAMDKLVLNTIQICSHT